MKYLLCVCCCLLAGCLWGQTIPLQYAQAPLIGLALARSGDAFLPHLSPSTSQDSGIFASAGYNNSKYKTGSGFDLKNSVFTGGIARGQDNTAGGLFFQYADGRHRTSPAYAKGDANSYAAGFFSSWELMENCMFSVLARAGNQKVEINHPALNQNLRSKSVFYGADAAAEHRFETWKAFTRFSWLHKLSDDQTTDLNQRLHFDSADSYVLSAGVEVLPEPDLNEPFVPAAGIEISYEFDGRAHTQLDGANLERPELKGVTVFPRVGIRYQTPDGKISAGADVLFAFGRQEGWGGALHASLAL